MKLIIDQLKECIRSHPSVVHSSIGSNPDWNRTQCIVLSQIISDALTKTTFLKNSKKNKTSLSISGMTLQRIFNDAYTEKTNPDLRFLKTLDKLAIFLGHPSLNDFLSHQKTKETNPKTDQNKAFTEEFKELVSNYCLEEFKCIQKLPKIDLGNLTDYLFADGPLIKRISDALQRYSALNFKINSTDNRSNFEVYDFKLSSADNSLVVLSAKKFWNIEWQNKKDDPVKVYNKINKQTYFIKKKDGIWKIWDNHNPDYNGLITESEETSLKENVLI
ncbi:hypothetical protein FEDK69T_12420 [Flavobacterium enshiense DK69]|uniref:Uncharacterized protein n=1 Tax=Flavobacterium enshiense DK69 TaxID=1107311 RepID=V6SFA2_9FLAO|nr:hypothetical protein [Flavobacterium enshiense]ESU23095.1 hypothetical protein FEDK69T_12420 [Flavobacterium enshiense DK69]KGO96041.1 hypothetical protein Q767_07195 [Flavobacterium enshiense DK69]